MKKILALFLAVTFLFGTLPLYTVVFAASDNTCGGEGNESNVTWSFDEATGTLTISGTGTMANWYHKMDLAIAGSFGYNVEDYLPANKEYVYTPWYSIRNQILHAVVGDGITTLGDFTFSGCENLLDVQLSKDLTVIGHAAFENCASLAKVEIPAGVTDIGVGAFYSNISATSVTVPEGVVNIAYGAFSLCTSLKEISLPSTLETLSALTFAFCQKLSSIEIPEAVPGISGYTFFRCTELSKVTFKGDIKYINQNAFADCRFLNNFTIPESVTTISDSAFSGCRRLVTFNVYPGSYGEAYCKENYSGSDYTINTIQHQWTVAEVVLPTCSQPGYTLEECSLCGEQREVNPVDPTGNHSYGSYTTISNPGCVTPGRKERTCKQCGYLDVLETPAMGHICGEWEVKSTATCSTEGIKTRTCYFCGDVETEITPALPHAYGEWEIIREPVWGTDGEQRRTCGTCSYVEIQKIPFHDHAYSTVIVPATCTRGGYTTYTCSCGESYVADHTDPLPHAFGGWEITREPACGIDGEQSRTCSSCGRVERETIPSNDHAYTAAVTPPTCTAGGYTTYTCDCGASYVTDRTDPLSHTYGEWETIIDPSCETEGKQTRVCTACGYEETNTLPATGHTYTAAVTPSTCTKEGYTTYTCHCGASYVSDQTAVLPHTFGDWTLAEPGLEHRTCSSCGAEETREVDLYGDVDGNRKVDRDDLTLLMSVLVGKTSGEGKYTDLDSDGRLTVYDCVLLQQLLNSMA